VPPAEEDEIAAAAMAADVNEAPAAALAPALLLPLPVLSADRNDVLPGAWGVAQFAHASAVGSAAADAAPPSSLLLLNNPASNCR